MEESKPALASFTVECENTRCCLKILNGDQAQGNNRYFYIHTGTNLYMQMLRRKGVQQNAKNRTCKLLCCTCFCKNYKRYFQNENSQLDWRRGFFLDCAFGLSSNSYFPLQPLVFLQCTNYMLPCYPVPRTVINCTKAVCKCNASKLAVYLSEISHKQTSLTLFSSTQCCLLGQTEHRTFCTNVTAATELNLLQNISRSRI